MKPPATSATQFDADEDSERQTGSYRQAAVPELSPAETKGLLRLVFHSPSLRCHYDLLVWLNSDLQRFLPHQMLVSAWGDLAGGDFSVDIASGLPGVSTARLGHCRIEEFVGAWYELWLAMKRRPVLRVGAAASGLGTRCSCPVHAAIGRMQCVVVHGVSDARSGEESIYIAMHQHIMIDFYRARFLPLAQALVSQIDAAFRKVSAYPRKRAASDESALGLSAREWEILEWLSRGKPNSDIATLLQIRLATVKCHMQSIFRKIHVDNRTAAAARYHETRGRPLY